MSSSVYHHRIPGKLELKGDKNRQTFNKKRKAVVANNNKQTKSNNTNHETLKITIESADNNQIQEKNSENKQENKDNSATDNDTNSNKLRKLTASESSSSNSNTDTVTDTSTTSQTRSEESFNRTQELLYSRLISKKISSSHRETIQKFNQHLANLSEHHDIPKISPG